MPQSLAMLTQMGEGYQPLAPGIAPSRHNPLQGMPLIGGGGLGGMAGMAMLPNIYRGFGQVGMIPMGIGHDQNIYDQLAKQRFTQAQMRAISLAAEVDRDGYMTTFRGLAALSGTPFGAEQHRAAQALSSAAVFASPALAEVMPDLLDQLGGARGSAAVMAKRVMEAGRYRIDPVTGRMGMSADTVSSMVHSAVTEMRDPAGVGRAHGLTAGQLGALTESLQSRGMIGSYGASATGSDLKSQLERAVNELRRDRPDFKPGGIDVSKGVGGLSGSDIDKLALDPGVADKLRSFDTDRVKRSLRSYAGAVAAMRDIFGDMGRPNAPMSELVQGLEALTNGSLAQLDPTRVAGIARQTYNLAKQTGVTVDNALIIQQHASAKAQQMGVEPIFGVQAAQGGLGFGGAYRAQGHAAHTAWGAMTADQLQQLDVNLRVQASSSNMANRMAVATRLSERLGGFQDDSDAARFVQASRAGVNEWQDTKGNRRSMMVTDGDFVRMLTTAKNREGRSANISENDLRSMLDQRDTNREYVERYNMTSVVRRGQREEMEGFVGHRMQEVLTSRLSDDLVRQGVDRGEAFSRARTASAAVARRVTRRMFDMSTEQFADNDSRSRGVGEALEEELGVAGHGNILAGMDPDDRQRFLAQTADRFYGSANRAIQTSIYSAFGGLQNVHRTMNKNTLDEADRQQMQARFKAEMQEALSPLGQGTVLSRAVEALRDLRPGDEGGLGKVLTSALGGVRTQDINKAIMPKLLTLHEKRKGLEQLQDDLAKEKDPSKRTETMRQLEVARRELLAQSKELVGIGEQFGLFSTESLGHEDLSRASRSGRHLETAQKDLVGLSGGFGNEVSETQLEEAKKEFGKPADENTAMAVILARQQRDVASIQRYAVDKDHKLTPGQQKMFDSTVESMKASMKGLSDDQARDAAVDYITSRSGINYVSKSALDREMRSLGSGQSLADRMADDMVSGKKLDPLGNKLSDHEARALVRVQRRMTPWRAEKADIDAVMKEYKGNITEGEAAELVNARLRASRLGVDKDEATKLMAERKASGMQAEMDAIKTIFERKENERFVVTDDDRKAFKKTFNPVPPTEDEMKRFREKNPEFKNSTEDAVRDAMTDRLILQGRQSANNDQFNRMWASPEGGAFRQTVDMANQDAENVAHRLSQTPQMTLRLGSRAIEYSKTLREGSQRLDELALYHTGGDQARLLAGQLKLDLSGPKGQETAKRVRDEVSKIQAERKRIFNALEEQEGLRGRQFELGDEDEATEHVLKTLPAAEAAELRKKAVTAEQRRLARRGAQEYGTEEKAREILSIPKGVTDLTDWQRSKIAGVRYGSGNEEQVIGLVGQTNWDKMTPAQQAAMTVNARKGFGSRASALDTLKDDTGKSLREIQGIRDLTDEEEERITASTYGLTSERYRRSLAGVGMGVLNDEQKAKLADVTQGIATEDRARQRMGLPEDPMSPELRQLILRRREDVGNDAEARRLLGFAPDKKLTAVEEKQLAQLTYDVGIARRLSPAQEGMLVKYDKREEQMKKMADRQGVTTVEMEKLAKGEAVGANLTKLSPEETKRHTEAVRMVGTAEGRVKREKTMQQSLESQIKALGDDTTNEAINKRREGLKATLEESKKRLTGFEKDRTDALGTVGEDAKRRGVKPEEYLTGKGSVTQGTIDTYKKLLAERGADDLEVVTMAKELGIKKEDLVGGSGVTKRLLEYQKDNMKKDNVNPQDLVKGILKEHGFSVGDELTPQQKYIAGLMESSRGRSMGKRMLDTAKTLRETAGRAGAADTAGVDSMATEYFKFVGEGDATKRKAAAAEFQKKYGFEVDSRGLMTGATSERWRRFEQAMQFQQQTGLLGFGKNNETGHRTRNSQEDLARLFTEAMRGGELKGPTPGGGTESGGQRITGTLDITLKGDGGTGDLTGIFGSGR